MFIAGKKSFLVTALVSGALAAGTFGIAQAKMGFDGRGDKGARMEHMAQQLGLNDAQKAQMKTVHERFAPQRQQLQEQGKKLHDERRTAMQGGNANAAQLEALRQKEVALFDQRSKLRQEEMLALSQILTPEQRSKMADMRSKRGEHQGGKRYSQGGRADQDAGLQKQ